MASKKEEFKVSDGKRRSDIKPGMSVGIVQKEDQPTGYITYGRVVKILTNSPTHPHGVKVRLDTGEVGRIKEIVK